MILRRFDRLSCSLRRVHASMNMFARQRIKSPEYHHMICIGKTKCTSEKGLLDFVSYNSGSNRAGNFKSYSALYGFELTFAITPWIVLYSVQLLLLIQKKTAIWHSVTRSGYVSLYWRMRILWLSHFYSRTRIIISEIKEIIFCLSHFVLIIRPHLTSFSHFSLSAL